ncbi:MAG: hypothetical protein GY723_03805 [bacterium]|nr:hypothetical protein [bacterium]
MHERPGAPAPLPTQLVLEAPGFANPQNPLMRWIASAEQIRSVLPAGPINQTDRLLLEFSAYRAGPPRQTDVGRNLTLLLAAQAAAPSAAGDSFSPPDAGPARSLQQAWAMSLRGEDSGALRLTRKLAKKYPQAPSVRAALGLFREPR